MKKTPRQILHDLTSRLAGADSALEALHGAGEALRQADEDLQAERARLVGNQAKQEHVIEGGWLARQIADVNEKIADVEAQRAGLAAQAAALGITIDRLARV